ncbi:hypothetical protein ACSNOH_19575 [Streptomyces sp. URMC 127]|uniref:hypothetical protein n=1 Tax=Streptomyces sp. URMC 127 TaxID=3423402 RepID=UPI003F1D88F4
MKAIRKSVVAATGIALALSLAACGGGGAGRQKDDAGADTALKTADPVTALKAAVAKGAEQNTYRTKGMRKNHEGEFTTEGAYQVKPDASDGKDVGPKTADAPDGVSHVIYVDDKMYVNTAKIPGKKWWTLDMKGAEDPDASEPFVLTASALATAEDVRNTGVETVGGRRAAHYEGTVVLSRLAAYKGDAMKEKDRDFYVKTRKDEGLEKVAVGVWADKDGVIVKTEESGKGSKGEYRRADEYSDYGADLKIQPPPAADTATEKEALEVAKDLPGNKL